MVFEKPTATPEEIKKTEEGRKAYEKNRNNLSKELNPSIFDTEQWLANHGHYTGERLVQMEAIEEDKRRTELAKVREKIASSYDNSEDSEKERQLSEELVKKQNSSLYLEENLPITQQIAEVVGDKRPIKQVLKGIINGKKINIEVSPRKGTYFLSDPIKEPENFIFKGRVDGNKISSEESIKLFQDYNASATKEEDYWTQG